MLLPNGSDLNYDQINVESPRGRQREIACHSWTTASGTVRPTMFKIMDDEGKVHTFDHINVNLCEKKIYCGIPSLEYNCDVCFNGLTFTLTLQYFPERTKWYLLERELK